ncbi:MAG: hypothetical protein NTV51_10760 [Verrucomicrobia bacterium]|nr:hypothetical protein [Verrucomicrobiota bacterium]
MNPEPCESPGAPDHQTPEWVKALAALMALGAWLLLLAILVLTPRRGAGGAAPAIAELGIFCYLGATGLALAGSALSRWGLTTAEKRADRGLRLAARGNYGALLLLIAIPVWQTCASLLR